MIIEGNLLIGILIAASLAIAALVVFIRFAVKKDSSGVESLFSRLQGAGDQDGEEAAAEASPAVAAPPETGLGGGLSLPGLSPESDKAFAEEAAPKKSLFSVDIGGLFAGLFGSRKRKDKIKEEVRVIDEQLNNVLQETGEINVPGAAPQISAADTPFSEGRGMRELDMEMGALQTPFDVVKPEELKLEPPTIDLSPAPAPKPEAEAAQAARKKADAPKAPPAVEQAKAPDFFDGPKKEVGDDLLSDLEAASKQEEELDMSIMKEYRDMPITCVEIESDLKSILDQININGQNKRNSRQ